MGGYGGPNDVRIAALGAGGNTGGQYEHPLREPYTVVDVQAEYRLSDVAVLQAGVTNVFEKIYVGSTLVVDQARADQAVFIPGEGRGFYVGTALQF